MRAESRFRPQYHQSSKGIRKADAKFPPRQARQGAENKYLPPVSDTTPMPKPMPRGPGWRERTMSRAKLISVERPNRRGRRRSKDRLVAPSAIVHPKQRIVADRQHQPFGKARCWSAAACQPQVADDSFQPCHPPDRVSTTLSPNRSAKIRRRQWGTSQMNRRVITRRRFNHFRTGWSEIFGALHLANVRGSRLSRI